MRGCVAIYISQPGACLIWGNMQLLGSYFDSQMLKHCANFPRALEVLLNAYPCVPSCDPWVEAVLPELWQVWPLQGSSFFLAGWRGQREDRPWAEEGRQ